jgi:hypothetical protein
MLQMPYTEKYQGYMQYKFGMVSLV